MSNIYGAGRSNYFKVKDEGLFIAWCKEREIHCEEINSKKSGRLFTIFGDDKTGELPRDMQNAEGDEVAIDAATEISQMLHSGYVFIWMAAGQQQRQYVGGYAYWINEIGERGSVDLHSIYAMAKKANPNAISDPVDPTS